MSFYFLVCKIIIYYNISVGTIEDWEYEDRNDGSRISFGTISGGREIYVLFCKIIVYYNIYVGTIEDWEYGDRNHGSRISLGTISRGCVAKVISYFYVGVLWFFLF